MAAILIPDLDQLKFAGVRIPFESIQVRGGLRKAVHEYPHAAGGAPEKLGRRLYEIDVQAKFSSGLINPDLLYLWPRQLNELQTAFDKQTTQDLQLPNIGTLKAFCTNWTRTLASTFLNGENVSLQFQEDLAEKFLAEMALTGNVTGITAMNSVLQIEGAKIDPKPSIFDAIDAAVNAVRAILDTKDLYGQLLDAKIQTLLNILEEADRRWDAFNDPDNVTALEQLHQIWEATLELYNDVFQEGTSLQEYTVPSEMTVSDASVAIYGDTSKAVDIMQLNALEDPYSIRAGTTLRYYAEAA
jgi:hypothetical protein